MKFEMVEPPDENAATAGLRHPAPASEDPVGQEQPTVSEPDDAFVKPVRERMARTIDGVRASLNLLQAQVAEQSMAEAYRLADSAPATDPGAVFHPHRFTASKGRDGR